jgi:hypothetical protein
MVPTLVVWLLVAAVGAGDGDSSPPPPEPGTLSGRVLGPEGRPLAGARVRLNLPENDPWGRPAEAVSGADGRFRLGPTKPWYRHFAGSVTVDADGLVGEIVSNDALLIAPGADTDLGPIHLHHGRAFTGRVVRADGSPVVGATVEASAYRYRMGGLNASTTSRATLTTDADGRFRTPPLPTGQVWCNVMADGCQTGRTVARVLPVDRPGVVDELPEIRLEPETPIPGIVRDEAGRPIAGVRVVLTWDEAYTTDVEGRFTLRRRGVPTEFQLQADREGFVHFNRTFRVKPDGVYRAEDWLDATRDVGPRPSLEITMTRAGWIEGRAVDEQTGEPVAVSALACCLFDRNPDGSITLSSCAQHTFEPSGDGRFRFQYFAPAEYHLTVSAEGYHDGEAFTPAVTDLVDQSGVLVKLRRNTAGSRPAVATQAIEGTAMRDGMPVRTGWASLWKHAATRDAVNVVTMRGRTAEPGPIVYDRAPIRDGRYRLEVPNPGRWTVVVEEPGRPPTLARGVEVAFGQTKPLDLACGPGGTISGWVDGVPDAWRGRAWVVAFSKHSVHAEAPVDADGHFRLPTLPPGVYGLKAGHDAFADAERIRASDLKAADFDRPAEPWKRAVSVELWPGQDVDDVTLVLPAED